jgi:hypothetical protein
MGAWPISARQALEAEPKISGRRTSHFHCATTLASLGWAILKNSFGVEVSRLQVKYTINTTTIPLRNGCRGSKEGSAS